MSARLQEVFDKSKRVYIGHRNTIIEARLRTISTQHPRARFSDIGILWPRRYRWAPVRGRADQIYHALRQCAAVELDDLPQSHLTGGCVRFQIVRDGRTLDIALDCSDSNASIDPELADRCLLYFKMQYRKEGYGQRNIVPGGYVVHDRRFYL